MTWANYDDALAQLQGAGLLMGRDGMLVDTPKPVRVLVEGQGREKKGWYWLSTKILGGESYITGAFGVYQANDSGKQKILIKRDGRAVKLSAEEREAIKARHEADMRRVRAQREAEIANAARRAERVWRAYEPAGPCPYLQRKGVRPYGLRFSPNGSGAAAVPILRGGAICGLQILRSSPRPGQLAKEYFPKGMDKTGGYHLIGSPAAGGVILVAEGYATAASLHEASGLPVAVAFDAGSLLPVAQALTKAYRRARLVICADDDHVQRCRACGELTRVEIAACAHCGESHGTVNPGVTAAQNAAHAVAGTVLVPRFAEERPGNAKTLTDFNDLHLKEGLHVVRQQVEAHLAGQGLVSPERVLRFPAAHQGGGDDDNRLANRVSIDEACERYSLVYGGKGTLFDHQEHCLVPKADVLDLLPDSGWRDWKQRPERKVVRLSEVGFDPAETDPGIRCNLWSGWPTEAREGKCDRLLNVLQHLCSAEQNARDLYQWVLRWLAYPIQHPGAKMRTALIFHGPQGVGKNLFFETVMSIYGRYGRIVDQAAVEDKFNDWMSGKLFLIADEVVTRAELYHIKNKLKGIVTGEWIRINPKQVAAHDERNHVNLVFLSNETMPLVLEQDDRRYVVVWTPQKMPRDAYEAVRDELQAGGASALHHYLANIDLGDFSEVSEPPMTAAKRDLIDLSLGSVERFLALWQEGDVQLGGETLPFVPCASADLYQAYKRWCVQEGIARPREQSAFLGQIAKLPGWKRGHADRYASFHATGSTVRCRMVVPGEAELADAAKRAHRDDDPRRRPEETLANWHTRGYFAFQGALRGALGGGGFEERDA